MEDRVDLFQPVATVNRPVIDRGLFPSTKTHGQEGADRGYPLVTEEGRRQTNQRADAACLPQAGLEIDPAWRDCRPIPQSGTRI